jgi:hypothetical protein
VVTNGSPTRRRRGLDSNFQYAGAVNSRESGASDAFLDQLDNQLTVRDEVAYIVHYDRVWPLLRHFGEHALVLGRRRLLERHGDQRDIQPPADFPKPS